MNSEFAISGLTAGQLNALVKNLMRQMGVSDPAEAVRRVNAGECVISQSKCIIDADADPFIPEGWKVIEHKKCGQLTWGLDRIELYLSEKQKGDYVEGEKLRKELANKPVLNANVLDYLLKNPHLIPEGWKGKAVFFWGTIYRHSYGSLCVRYLYWDATGSTTTSAIATPRRCAQVSPRNFVS